MESLEKVEQLTTNDPYSITKWNDGATPALNADNLNKIETAIEKNRATGNSLIGEVNKTQKNNEALEKNIKEVNDKYQAADASINEKINSLTLSSLKDQTTDIIVLDGGEDK